MRHRVAHRKLGRVTEHRLAMLRNQTLALLRHERIETTVPRAKELRPFVERIITIAKRGLAGQAENGRALHARRLVLRDIPDRTVVAKLFETIAPRFAERPGGYTRILRIGFRRGDGAELAQLELVGSEYSPKVETGEGAQAGKAADKKGKGVGGRLRAAANRIRGKSDAAPAEEKKTRATTDPASRRSSAARRKSAKGSKKSGD